MSNASGTKIADIKINTDKIVFLLGRGDGNYSKQVINTSYNPNYFRNKDAWGLIKIQKSTSKKSTI